MIVQADAREIPLVDNSVQCCITSPPYWGLRDYGVTGQLGLERTPEEYVANMVAVFREVKRVLRDDGTCWVNMGDCYGGYFGDKYAHKPFGEDRTADMSTPPNKPSNGAMAKQLMGIPWRIAFALQADGWYLRSDIIWAKPNPMPESVTDRPTKSHEYIFLLTKSARYYYDQVAASEPLDRPDDAFRKTPARFGGADKWEEAQKQSRLHSGNEYLGTPNGTRNLRSVWNIATQAFSGAHFATFPEEIPKRCILAGTSANGCCAVCGAPWERVVERSGGTIGKSWHPHQNDSVSGMSQYDPTTQKGGVGKARDSNGDQYTVQTTGWRPTCSCNVAIVPCVVLDPFAGSGTTVAVAESLGRCGIGLELKPEYIALARKRLSLVTLGLPL